MGMVFCRGCGKQIHETAPACPICGAPQALAAPQGMAAPQAATRQSAPASQPEVVSDSWLKRFALIEKAGGAKLPNARKKLTAMQRLSVGFNLWGFFLGPVYYMVKGMWKRAILLTAISLIATVILALILEKLRIKAGAVNFLAPLLFAAKANVDYYKKVVMRDNGWW